MNELVHYFVTQIQKSSEEDYFDNCLYLNSYHLAWNTILGYLIDLMQLTTAANHRGVDELVYSMYCE